jgi:hypothetical protein
MNRPGWSLTRPTRQAGLEISDCTFTRRKAELAGAGQIVCDQRGNYHRAGFSHSPADAPGTAPANPGCAQTFREYQRP